MNRLAGIRGLLIKSCLVLTLESDTLEGVWGEWSGFLLFLVLTGGGVLGAEVDALFLDAAFPLSELKLYKSSSCGRCGVVEEEGKGLVAAVEVKSKLKKSSLSFSSSICCEAREEEEEEEEAGLALVSVSVSESESLISICSMTSEPLVTK